MGLLASCDASPPSSSNKTEPQSLSSRGKSVYMASCIACHNTNPKIPGNVGPEIWGSTLELLEARILRAEYPSGYKPKRGTKAMASLPHLKNEIAALHAFLNER